MPAFCPTTIQLAYKQRLSEPANWQQQMLQWPGFRFNLEHDFRLFLVGNNIPGSAAAARNHYRRIACWQGACD
ncbi:hypothetical protein MPL3356_280033 [Mesorhizobium plurifarium]|uniref:Uncharacterized protein n=1 Tax=Mesorhizobium plurifarium TaxID=69974 RepID=A0A090EJV9_MESPL|nr:hypothetical protein MPL3356_280033 [Mesorhizobium plurifarium]CDX30928.1 hypothetical protein MPLDJ20_140098 [Mesorhizobium plurifarium]